MKNIVKLSVHLIAFIFIFAVLFYAFGFSGIVVPISIVGLGYLYHTKS